MRDWQNDLYWTLIAYTAIVGGAVLTIAGLLLFVPVLRRRWLPLPRLRPGAWTGHEVFLAYCVMTGIPTLILAILLLIGFFNPLIGAAPDKAGNEQSIYGFRCLIISTPLGLAVMLAFLFPLLFVRTGCRPHHLGLSWARWPANLALGLAAFIPTTPIVLGVQLLATLGSSEHPHALAQLGDADIYEWEWIFIAFSATVAAPMMEEIVFRGVLLGWLRRATLTGHLGVVSATILFALAQSWLKDPNGHTHSFYPEPGIVAVLLVAGYLYLMFRLARQFQLDEEEIKNWQPNSSGLESREADDQKQRSWATANAQLAIYGSAMLFAAAHTSAWPAPIAIFVLALVLGYLASRTQNLLAPITLHALFNLVSFITLYGAAHYVLDVNGSAQTTAAAGPSGVSAICVPTSELPLRK